MTSRVQGGQIEADEKVHDNDENCFQRSNLKQDGINDGKDNVSTTLKFDSMAIYVLILTTQSYLLKVLVS